MCGRFALSHSARKVEETFGVAGVEPFPPRYNIAPTQPVLVVIAADARPDGSNLPDRDARLMRWGLLPAWVKEPGEFPLVINARGETAATRASFRAAMRHRRCILPASGFYEWKRHKPSGQSQPFWIHPPGTGLVGLAGLWETWLGSDGSEIDTVAIVTTEAPADLAAIHHRVPVTVAADDQPRWLDCRAFAPTDVADLIAPPAPGRLVAVAVSDRVNKVANSDATIQSPVEPKPFARQTAEERPAHPRQPGDKQGHLF